MVLYWQDNLTLPTSMYIHRRVQVAVEKASGNPYPYIYIFLAPDAQDHPLSSFRPIPTATSNPHSYPSVPQGP